MVQFISSLTVFFCLFALFSQHSAVEFFFIIYDSLSCHVIMSLCEKFDAEPVLILCQMNGQIDCCVDDLSMLF